MAKHQYKQKRSYNYEKRKRFSYRQNQYEGTSDSDKVYLIYKSTRQQIKRRGVLECNNQRKLVRTGNVGKAKKKNKKGMMVFAENVPTEQMRNDFFALLRCNLIVINEAFKQSNTISYKIETQKGETIFLQISQKNLAHLLGISEIMGEKSMVVFCGIDKWRNLSVVDRLNQLAESKNQIESFEKENGMFINYIKGKEKNKNLFLFDLFNKKKTQVFCKKLRQADVNKLYEGIFGGESRNDDEYVILERKKEIDSENRYISMLFKKVYDEKTGKSRYCPVSIVETPERKLSDSDSATIKKLEISIEKCVKSNIWNVTIEEVNASLSYKNASNQRGEITND